MLYLNKYEKDGKIEYEVTENYSAYCTMCSIPDNIYYIVETSHESLFGWNKDQTFLYILNSKVEPNEVCDDYHTFNSFIKSQPSCKVLLDKSKPHTTSSVNESSVDTKNIDHKLEWIKKWMEGGTKVQYKLSVTPDDDKQWHNFTEGAFQYLKRSDLHFREAPKYVTLNGIMFKTIDSLLKHVKNNYDMS